MEYFSDIKDDIQIVECHLETIVGTFKLKDSSKKQQIQQQKPTHGQHKKMETFHAIMEIN